MEIAFTGIFVYSHTIYSMGTILVFQSWLECNKMAHVDFWRFNFGRIFSYAV